MQLPAILTTPIELGTFALPFSILQLVLELVLPGLAIILALRIVRSLLRRIAGRLSLSDSVLQKTNRWIKLITRVIALLLVAALIARLLGAEILRWSGDVIRILTQPFFVSGNTEISVVTLLLVIPVFSLAGWVARAARSMVEHGVLRRLNLDAARQFSILTIVRFTVMGISVIVGLSIIGINLSSLAVIFGVLGIGLGFGLQSAVANMFAGIVIIFSRPIKEGDRIVVGEHEGVVQTIKLLHTVVNTLTNETIIIPNSEITGSMVHNYSYDDVSIVLCNMIQVSYGSDLDAVGQVMIDVARRCPFRVPSGEPRYFVWSFDDSGITVRICTPIVDASRRVEAMSWVNLELWRAFRDRGIEIPFPQVDLHVRDVPRDLRGASVGLLGRASERRR